MYDQKFIRNVGTIIVAKMHALDEDGLDLVLAGKLVRVWIDLDYPGDSYEDSDIESVVRIVHSPVEYVKAICGSINVGGPTDEFIFPVLDRDYSKYDYLIDVDGNGESYDKDLFIESNEVEYRKHVAELAGHAELAESMKGELTGRRSLIRPGRHAEDASDTSYLREIRKFND